MTRRGSAVRRSGRRTTFMGHHAHSPAAPPALAALRRAWLLALLGSVPGVIDTPRARGLRLAIRLLSIVAATSLALTASLAVALPACTDFGGEDAPPRAADDGATDGATAGDSGPPSATVRSGSIGCQTPEKCRLPFYEGDASCTRRDLRSPFYPPRCASRSDRESAIPGERIALTKSAPALVASRPHGLGSGDPRLRADEP